jgi:hypothetical protein
MTKSLAALRREAGITRLLSKPNSNPKIAKNQKLGVYGTILHLSPATLSGVEFCPGRSPGCTTGCLNTAGNPVHGPAKEAGRLKRSRLLIERPELFRDILLLEIAAHVRAAKRLNMEPSIRLNGTSDIPWHRRFPEIFSRFPDVQFMDYTKVLHRHVPSNWHLTFSLAEDNLAKAERAFFELGMNVAVVFDRVPSSYSALRNTPIPVFDGDVTDHRPSDPRGVIVGLKAKGRARRDTTGFVQRTMTTDEYPISAAA